MKATLLELSLISTADGSARVLKSVPRSSWMYQNALLSPNGRTVAFSFVREGNPPHADLFVMTADGRSEVVVAGHPAEDRLLRWTPDGKGLLFLSPSTHKCGNVFVRSGLSAE